MAEEAKIQRVARSAAHRSRLRCSLCGEDLWLMPSAPEGVTVKEEEQMALQSHISQKHTIKA